VSVRVLWLFAVISAVLAVASVALFSYMAAHLVRGTPASSEEVIQCVVALALMFGSLGFAAKPIFEGPGRSLAVSAGVLAAFSPILGAILIRVLPPEFQGWVASWFPG
jgi:hypothetical protein